MSQAAQISSALLVMTRISIAGAPIFRFIPSGLALRDSEAGGEEDCQDLVPELCGESDDQSRKNRQQQANPQYQETPSTETRTNEIFLSSEFGGSSTPL